MPTDCVPYQKSGYFSPIIIDYLDQKPNLQSFYHRFPSIENFEKQLLEKQHHYDHSNRDILVTVLEKQYQSLEVSAKTQQNIQALRQNSTFTITTGHQLNLFTGPLYFLYKIVTTINLTKELKSKYPNYTFVPIYWMATEDHDFEEINYFNYKGKKFRWNKENKGPVGRGTTKGLQDVLDLFEKELGTSLNANVIKTLFEKAYLKHLTLTEATRYIANELFGTQGLVILDSDEKALKKKFVPYMKEELLEQTAFKKVSDTISKLKPYSIQVNPRAINLFYIEDALRERIVLDKDIYRVNATSVQFTKEELLALLEKNPEKFSPNVMLRPLYQEVILPNLCYIGGGGEIAYWLELKSYFESAGVVFPILLVRNSVLLATEKQAKKADRLGLSWADLFRNQNDLKNEKIKSFSAFPIDLTIQKEHLKNQFHYLHSLVVQTDQSFAGAVKAQEAKQLKGLDSLELRLLKAQKRKHADLLERITDLQNELFPNHGLQERQANFSEFYLENGSQLLEQLYSNLKPLEKEFTILVL